MLAALLDEISLRRDYLPQNQPIDTIYFGGGTPSLLTSRELDSLLSAIHSLYIVAPDAEISLEANPDDIQPQLLREWKGLGINRLSIGVQSFFEEDLKWMNRAHSAEDALRCCTWALEEGFHNFSIDLIYGGPTLSDQNWDQNIRTAMDLGITHLSCYALTVEPNTALDKLIGQGKKEKVDLDKQARQFLHLIENAEARGYEHYEISNFALPGKRSKHNSAYWQGRNYLGIGPSAHSFNGNSRQWNIAHNAKYIDALQQKKIPFEIEVLSAVQQLNEYIMIALRTAAGIQLDTVSARFGPAIATELETKVGYWIERGSVVQNNQSIQLNAEGKLLADGIASDLFFEEKN